MTRRLSRLWLPLVVVAVMVVPALVEFYTDWLWFGETGYRQVFLGSLSTKAVLAGTGWALGFGFLYMNARKPADIGLKAYDWVWVESHNGKIRCQLKTMERSWVDFT